MESVAFLTWDLIEDVFNKVPVSSDLATDFISPLTRPNATTTLKVLMATELCFFVMSAQGESIFFRLAMSHLKGPPQGYDCVFGKVGSSLNYAEIVVYNPDAVLPRYIIVYQKDGVNKI